MPRPWKAIHFPKRHAMTGQGDKRACQWCGGGMDGKQRNAVFCRQKCRDRFRKVNSPEKVKEFKRMYAEKYPDKVSAQRRKWYHENRERFAEYRREYRQANAESIAEYQREYKNNQSAAASTLSLAHTVSQFTADPPNRNGTPAQDKTP